jgi:hypothetical protein
MRMKDENQKIIKSELYHLIKKSYTPKSSIKNAYLKKTTRKIKEKCKRGNE